MKFKGTTVKWTKKLKAAVAALATAAAVALGGAFTAVGISVAARNQKLGGSIAGGVADTPTVDVTVGESISITTASDWEKVIAVQSTSTAYAEAKLTANITADATTHVFGEATSGLSPYSSYGALNVPEGKYVVLDLNGFTINRGLTSASVGGSVLSVEGTLIIKDSSARGSGVITGGYTSNNGGGVRMYETGTLTVAGGTISGNRAESSNTEYGSGGGIFNEGGNLTIIGGTVSGNTSSIMGGGIYVISADLTMTGGNICENTSVRGGGIFVNASNFDMSGNVEIHNNTAVTASDGTGGYAGGIYINNQNKTDTELIIDGGKIYDNNADINSGAISFTSNVANTVLQFKSGEIYGNSSRSIGGIMVNANAKMIMTGGSIHDNTAQTYAGGVCVNTNGVLEMNGGTISGNSTNSGNGGGVYVSGLFTMTGGTISENKVNSSEEAGSGIYFSGNSTVKMSGGLITKHDNLRGAVYGQGTFEMSGGEISGNHTTLGGAFYLSAGKLTISGNAKLVNNVSGSGGAVYCNSGTQITMSGGEISGNTSTGYGGGFSIDGGDLIINGGVITNNSSNEGGAIELNNWVSAGHATVYSSLNINDVEISGNTAFSRGGAICVDSGEVSLTDVTITDNVSNGMGGGIYSNATLNLHNVTVTNNTSGGLGGGIMVGGKTELSGKIVVKDNYLIQPPETIKNNMFLNSTQQLLTYGTIQSGSEIGVSGGGERTVYTGSSTATRPVFTADNPLWKIDSATSGSTVTVKLVKNVPAGITDSNAGLWNYAASNSSDTNPIQVDLSANWTYGAGGFGSGTGFSGGNLYVPQGRNIILNLNGYNIDRGLTSVASRGFIFDVQGTLTIIGTGRITGGYNDGDGGAFSVSSGKLVISGGTITGNTAANDSCGGAIYAISSTVIINGGTISDNTATYAGGAIFTSSSTVIINGGTITGNTVNGSVSLGSEVCGGGISINYGSFTMHGGTISGNAMDDLDKKIEPPGGGIYTFNAAVLIDGGTISGNTATWGGGAYFCGRQGSGEIGGNVFIHGNTAYGGGGVYFAEPKMTVSGGRIYNNTAEVGGGVYIDTMNESTMTGGEIYNNTATGKNNDKNVYGSDVCVDGVFTMTGGTIRTAATATNTAVGVYVNGIFEMRGGKLGQTATTATSVFARAVLVSGNSAEFDMYGGEISGFNELNRSPVRMDIGAFNMYGGEICNNKLGSGAGAVYVSGGAFNMSGGEIYNNISTYANGTGGGVFVSAGTFNLTGGTIYGNSANNGGGVYLGDGAFNMGGGKIYGNSANFGGGVYVSAGTFTLTGGEIYENTADYGAGIFTNGTLVLGSKTTVGSNTVYSGNAKIYGNRQITGSGTASQHGGGGIFVNNSGSLDLYGGTISGNVADGVGGGLLLGSCTVNIYGGSIINNSATVGGGIKLVGTTLKIYGGEISGNTATEQGGGVYVDGTLSIGGSTNITGNTLSDGKANNVYLPAGKVVSLSGTTNETHFGISADSLRRVITNLTPFDILKLQELARTDAEGVAVCYQNGSEGVGVYLVAGKTLTVTDNGGNVRTVSVEDGCSIRGTYDETDKEFKFNNNSNFYLTIDVSDIPVGYVPYIYYTSDTNKTELSSISMDIDRAVSIGYKAVEKGYTIYYIVGESSATDAELDTYAKQAANTSVYGYTGVGLTDSEIATLDESGAAFAPNGDYAVKEFTSREHYSVSRVVGELTVDGTGTQVIRVYLEAKKYAITFSLNGAPVPDGMTADDFIYELGYGATYTAPVSDISRPAYEFLGWFDKSDATENDVPVDFGTGLTVSEDVTYYAGWKLVGYKLTLNYDIHETDSTANYTYEVFNGQRMMVVRNNDWQYNKLERFVYTMAYGESAAAQELITWTPGNSQIRIAEPAAEGFTFAGWYNANGQRVRYVYSNTEYDVEVWARWTPAVYNISFNANRGSISQAESIGSYTNFAPYGKLPEPTRSGHAFGGWYLTQEAADEGESEGNQNYVDSQTYMVLKGPVTLYASWKPIQHQITYGEEYGEGITAENIGRLYVNGKSWQSAVDRVDYGATVSIEVMLADDVSGYEVSVTQNGRPLGNPGTLIVRGDIEIVAHYTEITYNIRYSYNGGNAVDNDESGFVKQYTANSDGTVDLPTSVERVGYEFKGWMLQTFDATTDSTFYIIDGMRSYLKDHGGLRSVVLYAYWTPATLNVYLHKNFNGNDSNPDTISGVTGDRVTVDLTSIGAEENYILLGWATSPNSTNIAVAVGTDKDADDYGKGVYTIKPETKTKNGNWHESINNLYAVWHVAGAQTLIMSTSLQDGATVKEYDGNSFNLTARPLITYSETDTTLVLTYEWVKDGELVGEKIVRTAADFKGDRNEWLTVTLPVKNVSQSGTYTCNLTVSGSTVTGETMAMTSGSITVTVDKAEFGNVRLTNSFGNAYKGYKGEGYTYFAQYQPLGSGNWVNASSNMVLGEDLITVTYVYTLGDEVVDEMVNAGTYTVTAKFSMPDGSNYENIADRTCLFEVLPLVIDSVTYKLYGTTADGKLYEVNGFKDVFNGREFKVVASASVVDGETFVLTDCDDLIIEITDNTAVNAGVYSAALTGLLGGEAADNYTLRIAENLTCGYEIEKATHDLKDVKFDDLSVDYDGDSHEIFLTYKGNKVEDGGVIEIDGFELTVGYSLEYTANNAFNHENDSKNGGVAAGVYTVTVSLTDDAANVNNFNEIKDISRTLTIEQKDFFEQYDREDMLGNFKTASVGYTTDESRFPKPVIDGADGDMSFNSAIFTVTYTYEQYKNNAYWTIFSGDAKALESFKGLGDPGSYRLTAHIAFAGGSDENEAFRNNYGEVGDITITYSIAEGTIVDITVKLVDGFQFFYGDKFDKSAIESINIQYQVAGNRDATRDEINESVIYGGESGTEVFTTFDRVGAYSVRISFFGEERTLKLNVKQKISEIAEWQYKLTSAPDSEASWKAIPAGGIEYNVSGYDFRAKFACVGTNGYDTYGYAEASAESSSLTVRDNAYALTAADSVGNYLLENQNGALKGEVKIIKNTTVTVKWYFDGEEITEDTEIIFGGDNKNFINNNFASLITVRYSIGGSEARPLSWDVKDGNGTPVINNAGDYVLVAVQGSAVDSNYALQGLKKTITVKPYVLSGADYTVEYDDAENGWSDLAEVNYELTYKGEEYKLRVSVRGEVTTTIDLVAVDGETEIAIRNAGTYNIICGAADYVLEDVLHGLKINKKSIKVEWAYENNATSLTYNGDEQGVVGTVKGCGTDGNDLIELSGHRQVNAGDKYIAFADLKTDAANPDKNYANNYVLTSDSFDWAIGKLAFKVNGWGSETFEYEYTGSVQSPSCDDNNIFAQDKNAINVILSYKAGELDIPATEVVSVDGYTVTATLRAAANADPNVVNNYSFENVTCEFAIIKATPKFTGFEYTEYKDETTTNRAYLNSPDGLREDKIVATFDGATVEGKFVFVDGKGEVIDGANVSLDTLGRNTFDIRFIPEDGDSYESVDATMDVVIYQDTSRTGDNSLIVDASKQNFFIMPSTVRVNLVKVYRTYSSYYYDEVLQRAFGKSEEVDASELEFKINGQNADGYEVKESDFSDGALSGTLTLNVAYKNSNNRIRGAATLNISKEQPLSIRLDETTLSKTWYEDETFDYSDASFVVDYASGERNLPTNQVSCDVTRFTSADAAAGTKIITFTFGGQTCQLTVNVLARKQLRAEYATDGYKVVGDGKTPVTDWKNYCTVTFVTADGETVNAADIEGLTISYILFLNNNRVDNPVSIGVTYSVRVSFTLNDKRFKSSIAEVTFSLTVTDVAYSVDFEKPADTSLVYDGGELICPEVIINGVTDLQGNPVAGTVRPEYKIVFKGQTVSNIVDAGEYTVTVTFTLGGEEIGKTTYTVHVGMGVNAVESFEVGSILVGGTVSPEAEFKFGEKSQVKFLYSYNGANGHYVSTVPSAAGEYWVIAVMEGTGNYERLESAAKRFTINQVSVSSDSKVEEEAKLVISDEVHGIEYGVEVDVTESEKSVNINKQNTLESYDLSILLGNNPAKIANAVTVRLLISEELKGRTDLNVYFVNGNGNAVNVNAKVSEDGKYLEFTASDLESGNLVITYAQPGQPTGLIVAVVILGVIAAGGVIACGVVFAKKRRNK